MRRHLAGLSVCALLPGLLLGCGGDTSEAVGAEPGESLGTQESALCSGLSVTSLVISDASTYQGTMAAVGTWAVSQFANAVRLDYYVDGVLYSSDERPGNSGTWYFSANGVACGTRTLMVKAYPMVIDSNDNRTTCWTAPNTVSQSVTEPCPGGTWNLMYTENCYDFFMESCYEHNFSSYCPSNPQGKSCPTVGASCYHVVSGSTFERYRCQ
ncbi:MAG TPA: hypothetical protein VLQ93_09270 [Myxococcaceae bacterium]|nr:hypothetical protein [Myxococcaceae bacterium]